MKIKKIICSIIIVSVFVSLFALPLNTKAKTIKEFEAEVELAYNNAETDEAKEIAKQHATEEFGDVLFSLINAARLYKINPDNALELTNQKFIKRFNYVEAKAKEKGLDLKDLTMAQMDTWWNEAKRLS